MVLPPHHMVAQPYRRRMNDLLWDMLCLVCNFCKTYKRGTLAVLFVLLEVISVILEIFGKNSVGSVLASFILSAFGVLVTLYTTFVVGQGVGNSQLVVVDIVFSFTQLIVTYIELIMKFLRTKSNYEVSLFPLAFVIIALVFTFKNNPVDPPNERPAASSILALGLQWEPPRVIVLSAPAPWPPALSEPLLLHKRFLRYVLQKITKVCDLLCDLLCKYKIHMLEVVCLVLDAISSVALDQLSGQSKQSFVLATSLLLPVFGFACIKGITTSNIEPGAERQLIGVVEVIFAMVQLIISTLVHFTLTISGATNNYNGPWFPLAFAAIVMFVFNKDEKNDSFKAIPMLGSGIVQRYIDLAGLNNFEDLYRKVEQMYNIEGQLFGSKSKWVLNYINKRHEWKVVGTGSGETWDWELFCWEAKVMMINRRRPIQSDDDYIDDDYTDYDDGANDDDGDTDNDDGANDDDGDTDNDDGANDDDGNEY